MLRKQGAKQLYEFVKNLDDDKLLHQEVLSTFCKPLLRLMSDSSEKVRENVLNSIKILCENADSLSQFLPYLLPILAQRVNCQDLEGILHLPEVQRPPPTTKPMMLVKLNEPVEELRLILAQIMGLLVNQSSQEDVFNYVDDFVNILRALVMDPCASVQLWTLQVMITFCNNNTEVLLHFTQPLGRSILFALTHHKSKNRIAALQTLTSILTCGVWKHNAFIMEIMIGFRDPNTVAIKDFFEYSQKLNYLAILINDQNASVRQAFIKSIGYWTTQLEDRYDHHTRLIPYLLSGLFDEFTDIRKLAVDIIEKCGAQLEEEKEKDFRDQKQLAVDCEWTQGGQLVDLPLPDPFSKRPRLGARFHVRSYIRQYLKALYKELVEPKDESREKACNLLMVTAVYTEDYLTQFLHQLIPGTVLSLMPFGNNPSDVKNAEKVQLVYHLIGRFCDFKSYHTILLSGLSGEYKDNHNYISANFRGIVNCFGGSMEATVKAGLGENKMDEFCQTIDFLSQTGFKENMAQANLQDLQKLLHICYQVIDERANEDEKNELIDKFSDKLLDLQLILINLYLEKHLLIHKILTQDQIEKTQHFMSQCQFKAYKKDFDIEMDIKQQFSYLFIDNNPEILKQIREKVDSNNFPSDILYLQKCALVLQQFYKDSPSATKIMGSVASWMIERKKLDNSDFFQNCKTFIDNQEQISIEVLPYFTETLYYLIKYNQNQKKQERSFLQLLQKGLNIIQPSDDFLENIKYQDKCVFGYFMDYILDQITIIKQPNITLSNITFELLNFLIDNIPISFQLKEFEDMITNFIKNIIDEADLDLRKQYFVAMRKVAAKIPQELQKVLHFAQRNKLYKRIEIIQACQTKE